jgi:uncharacterized protein YabN with tetrapyrrole methylase and pyrophosphatase domain
MRRLLLAAALAFSMPALAEVPAMTTAKDGDVSISVPDGWKTMVDAQTANVLASRDAATTMTIHWYPYGGKKSLDDMLNILLRVTNENLPMGAAKELSREDALDGKAKLMIAEYSNMLGYSMKLAFIARIDEAGKRVVTGVFLTDPESFESLSAKELAVKMVGRLEGGPRGPQKKVVTTTEGE